MTSGKTIFQDFIKKITIDESKDEITSIAYLVFEHLLGLSKTDIMSHSSVAVSPDKNDMLNDIIARINMYEPVQYILGKADFYGLTFKVDPSVLIPRPETEELVSLAIDALRGYSDQIVRVLDIGTGSGCIPIAIKSSCPEAEIFATDISENALDTARQNARNLHTDIIFLHHDILGSEIPLHNLHIITSNPPYITLKEKDNMSKNVVHHEPHTALFVPDNNPLIFYHAIGDKAKKVLVPNGLLLVEINEHFGTPVKKLFESQGFHKAKIHKDVSGKDRIVSCYTKSGGNFA